MNRCCSAFRIHFERAGDRGSAVFVSTKDNPPAFVVQHRSLDPGTSLSHTSVPLSLVADLIIRFCPWCGKNLSKHYKHLYKELHRSELRIGCF
jgi:hypothetical protein